MTQKVDAVQGTADSALAQANAAVAALVSGGLELPDPVFGIARVRTGGGSGLWFHTDKNCQPRGLGTAFFDRHPVYGNISRTLIDGQVMNAVPKFYVKHTVAESGPLLGCPVTLLSPTAAEGFRVYPAFMHDGAALDRFYLGSYAGSVNGTKLESVPGAMPAVSRTSTAFQTLCTNRNGGGVSGFMLQSVYQVAALQLLMLAEYATTNMQSVLGAGVVSASSAAAVDAAENHRPWRNFYGLYGNVWEKFSGLRTNAAKEIEIWRDDGSQAWVNTHTSYAITANSWPVTMQDSTGSGFDMRDVFVPKTLATSEAAGTYSDIAHVLEASGDFCVGGGWDGGSSAGIFALWSLTPNCTSAGVGARLAKV